MSEAAILSGLDACRLGPLPTIVWLIIGAAVILTNIAIIRTIITDRRALYGCRKALQEAHDELRITKRTLSTSEAERGWLKQQVERAAENGG